MRKRILRVFLAGVMAAAMAPAALAATSMMLRRTAMLNGDENWDQITESSCREAFWLSGRGLPYNFSYGDITVSHDTLPGGQANTQVLIDLLEEHPEGIMLHAACVPHGILLTSYEDGQFYCADPSEYAGEGIIPIEEAWGTRVENSNAYWYVTSEVAEPEAEPLLPEATVSVEESLSTLLTPISLEAVELLPSLTVQATTVVE